MMMTSMAGPGLELNNYTITRGYDAAGSLNSVTDSLGNALFSASYAYGLGAFMTGSTDADLGPWSYTINALGERTGWTDAKGQSFSATYDALSRPFTRSEPDLFTQWTWGTSAAVHEIGQLHSVCTGTGTAPPACTSATGYAESETYDGVGRLFQRSIQIPGDSTYTYQWAYNSTTGLLDTLTYPTSTSGYALVLKYAYTNGLLQSITDTSDPQPVAFWGADATNSAGQVTQETLGNRVVVNHTFDAVTAWPSSITAGVGGGAALQNNSYLWDNVGNLTQRQDNIAGVTENVYPDSLNRLSNTVGDTNTSLTYDTMGRLATWTVNGGTPPNVNDYTTPQSGCSYYGNAQPHAVRKVEYDPSQPNDYSSYCYDKNGNFVSTLVKWPTTYSWTSYNQPSSLSASGNSSQFFYDHNHQRWKQIATYGGSTETTEYIGGLLEKMTNSSGTAYRYYVSAGNNFIVYNRWLSGNNVVYYVTEDHLGSSAVVTDPNGALVVREKFAALGWNENTGAEEATIASVTRHGFTGQESLGNIGLVNMNGRVYLPSGSMFLSPDPYINDPTNTLSYNRYAYVNYNPLRYTDPSGFCLGEFPDGIFDDGLDCPEIIVPNQSPSGVPPFDWQALQPPPSLVPVAPPALANLTPPPQIRFLAPETGPQGNPQYGCGTPGVLVCQQPQDPCQSAGSAPSPQQYAAQGADLQRQTALLSGLDPVYGPLSASGNAVGALAGFRRGGPLDAQVLYGGSQAYANYAFGVYLSAAGYSLQDTLGYANTYGYFRSTYPVGTQMGTPNYPSIPASNVANITAGFYSQQDGTLCVKLGP